MLAFESLFFLLFLRCLNNKITNKYLNDLLQYRKIRERGRKNLNCFTIIPPGNNSTYQHKEIQLAPAFIC